MNTVGRSNHTCAASASGNIVLNPAVVEDAAADELAMLSPELSGEGGLAMEEELGAEVTEEELCGSVGSETVTVEGTGVWVKVPAPEERGGGGGG
jgi:hypothetical protein